MAFPVIAAAGNLEMFRPCPRSEEQEKLMKKVI
jgi:hypothetical protein